MKIEYVARHFEIDEDIRTYTEGKLRKVERFVEEPVDVHVTLVQEKHRHIAEIKLRHRHGIIQAAEETSEMPREGTRSIRSDRRRESPDPRKQSPKKRFPRRRVSYPSMVCGCPSLSCVSPL